MSSSILSGFVLSTFMSVVPADGAFANSEQEALRHISKACYKQFKIDKYVKVIEKKYIHKKIREYGGAIGVGLRIVAERRVSYVWRF